MSGPLQPRRLSARSAELRKKASQPQPTRPQRPASQPPAPAPPAFAPRPPDGAPESDTQSWRRPTAAQRLSAPDDTRTSEYGSWPSGPWGHRPRTVDVAAQIDCQNCTET